MWGVVDGRSNMLLYINIDCEGHLDSRVVRGRAGKVWGT